MYLKTTSISCYNVIKISILILFCLNHSRLFSQQQNLRFTHITVKEGLAQNRVLGIVKDKYGFMWFTTWEGLSKYDGYKFTNYVADNHNSKAIQSNRIHQLYKDPRGNLWILTFDTLAFRYNYETDDFNRFTKKEVPKIIFDSLEWARNLIYSKVKTANYQWNVQQQDNTFVSSLLMNKIVQTFTKTGEKLVYRQDPLNPWALNDETVFCITKDDNDIFWVGTAGGGVNKADLRQKKFALYQHSIMDKNTIIDNSIRAICEDNRGNLWIGTLSSGLTKIVRKQNKYTHYQYNYKNNANSLIDNQVRVIYCDKKGYIWIGTKVGLDRFDPKNDRFHHYIKDSKSGLPNNSIFWITEDQSDNLWIGTMNGIARYDKEQDNFIAFPTNYSPMQQRVRVIINDEKNSFWIATDGGGLLHVRLTISEKNQEQLSLIAQYLNLPNNPNSLSDNRIYAILKDDRGHIWLGTGGGLDRFDPLSATFKHFNKKNGLPDELIMGILKDDRGDIWVSHKRGLSKINTQNFRIRNFSQQDGLQDDEFAEDAYFQSKYTGEMFFGGVNGFNAFYPDSIIDNPFIPKIVLTSLEISNIPVTLNKSFNGRVILTKPLYMTPAITLTYRDKSVTLEFAALHYSNPMNNRYAYKLEGFDQDWISTDATRRTASYSNLAPQTYTFKVKASNNDGLWNPTPLELKIIVLPPWWKTTIFKIFILFLFGLSLYLAYYLRLEAYKKKQKELSLLVKQRTIELEKSNEQMLQQQTQIEEQTEVIRTNAEELKVVNERLLEQTDELKETNQQLSVLNSTKDRFFSIIAHDLRNPFHVVSGFSEILLNDYDKLPPEKINKFLHLIYATSSNGRNLLENLLLWSRSQTGRIAYDPAKIILATVIEETINLLDGDVQRKNISIQRLVDNHILVWADENMLKTVIRNLISNALKFSFEEGVITIKAIVQDSYVEVSVADTGVGISPENLALLFRIDATITTKGTSNEIGTGLGLIICKEFIERHNGKIWVESEPGKGSQFKFTLPLP